MRSQGIKGPSYNFLHGNTKEAFDMKNQAMKTTLPTLSNVILPRVQPDIYLWTKLYGRNFLSWHGYRAELYVTEPDLIKEVLNNKNGVFKKSVGEKYMHKVMGNGLGIAEGKKWLKQRKLANHAFQIEKLKHMVPTIVGSVENMLEKWKHHEGKEINVHEEFRILTSDVLSKTAFGSSYLEGQKIFEKLGRLLSLVTANKLKVDLPIIGKLLNYYTNSEVDDLEKEIRESFMEIIRKRIEKKESGELDDYGSDYLGLLVAANKETDDEKKVSIDTLIDECKTAYFAGQDTTMALLSWVIFLLAIHTDWQEKARKEVFDLFGDKQPNTSDNSLAKMKI
ncbi:Cytochrome p450, partial [Thalictrum thalictroides]